MQAHSKTVKQIITPTEKELAAYARTKITRLSARLRKIWKKDNQRLAFTAWSYFAQLSKLKRTQGQRPVAPVRDSVSEKVIIRQRLEVYDGTLEVWTTTRKQIVAWLESIFARCNSHLDPSKQ